MIFRQTHRIALALLVGLGAPVLYACGSSSSSDVPEASDGGDGGSPGTGADASVDSGVSADGTDAEPVSDASGDGATDGEGVYDGATVEAGVLTECRTTGVGAFLVSGTTCFNFTPVQAGEPSTGVNASAVQYAIRPGTTSAAPAHLVLFLIGSGGEPVDVLRPGPTTNVYGAAVSDGNAVMGLSYDNAVAVGDLCGNDDGCYFPTRQSIILGVTETGSALTVTTDEGIVDRLAHGLRYLAASDPAGGWGAFLTTLDPSEPGATAVAWGSVIATGHSQGGGHAAAIGKLFPVERVVQLSSTCDGDDGKSATWTDGTVGTWMSDPTQFWGLAAPSTIVDGGLTGDTSCPYHALDWANLGMLTSHRDDAAAICGETGDTHSESLVCADNYPAWLALYK